MLKKYRHKLAKKKDKEQEKIANSAVVEARISSVQF